MADYEGVKIWRADRVGVRQGRANCEWEII